MMLLSNPGISVQSQAKQSGYFFKRAIIGPGKLGSNFLLINVGRGLSPGPMSISSSSSADVNPYPSFPSPVKSMLNTGQTVGEDNKNNLGRLPESAPFLIALVKDGLHLICDLQWQGISLLRLHDLLVVRLLLFIFCGRSQGSAVPRTIVDFATLSGRWIRPASPRFL